MNKLVKQTKKKAIHIPSTRYDNTAPSIKDPSITIVCGNKHISLVRKSGGEPMFGLYDFGEKMIVNRYTHCYLRSKKQFDKLWEFILRELYRPSQIQDGGLI